MRFKLLLLFMLLTSPAFAAVTSLDYTFVANDQYASDFYSKLNSNFSKVLTGGVNNIEAANIKNDTIVEADMADEINPRIRFYEMGGSGSECEMVYTGLLPVTSASLTTDTSAGTAYVRGYRINKSSSTSKTYTADKWTYVDLDTAGDFQYTEVSIGAPSPAVATNSIRLARVSTDLATVNTVSDMRTTSCTTASFTGTKEVATEASLNDILKNGQVVKKTFGKTGALTTPDGFAQGAFASYDTQTTFTISSGGLYINGKYRANSSPITVTTGADDPTNGVSGIVSGAIGSTTTYNIYAVADQDAVKTFSVSYGAGPTGLANYRLIGSIATDGSSHFTSSDIAVAHAIMPSELKSIKGWANFSGAAGAINKSYNVSGIVRNDTGDYTISWDNDFANANYAIAGTTQADNGPNEGTGTTNLSIKRVAGAQTAGAVNVVTVSYGGSKVDAAIITIIATGD